MGPSSPEAHLLRAAMTRCPGGPLEDWLDAETVVARQRGVSSTTSDCASGPRVDEVSDYCNSFLGAASVARAMVSQLAPTFGRLNDGGIAYHRDVNARNLLVSSAPAGSPGDASLRALPEFSLVDFGASIESRTWVGAGEGSWQS